MRRTTATMKHAEKDTIATVSSTASARIGTASSAASPVQLKWRSRGTATCIQESSHCKTTDFRNRNISLSFDPDVCLFFRNPNLTSVSNLTVSKKKNFQDQNAGRRNEATRYFGLGVMLFANSEVCTDEKFERALLTRCRRIDVSSL